MIQLDEGTLRNLQLLELEMLVEVDRICKKNHISYNIIGGTLLGAIRHGGFIPWDDDADLVMLRPAYEKFREACDTELDKDKYYFQDARNTAGYRWGYGKLRRKGTVFLREHQEHMPYEQGVFIDIFPLDTVPDEYYKRKLLDLHCFCIRKILWSAVGRYADRRFFHRLWFKCLYKIPYSWVLSYIDHLVEKCNRSITRRVRILFMPSPNQEYCYYRKWFEEEFPVSFEGILLSGIRDYDGFLTFEFGDYMRIPPVEKRKIHPVSQIKLVEPSVKGTKNES